MHACTDVTEVTEAALAAAGAPDAAAAAGSALAATAGAKEEASCRQAAQVRAMMASERRSELMRQIAAASTALSRPSSALSCAHV